MRMRLPLWSAREGGVQVSWKCRCLLAGFSLFSMSSHASAEMIRLLTRGDIFGNVFVAHYDAAGNIRAGASDQFGQGSGEPTPVGLDFWTATDMTAAAIFTASGTSAASQ